MTSIPALAAGIVEAAKAGDHAAFEVIFTTYREDIWRYVYHQMGQSIPDAYELTQDTFLKAWLNLTDPSSSAYQDPDLRLTPWLFRIATNTCRDEQRHRKLVEWRPWEVYADTFHPSQIADDNPERDALRAEDAAETALILAQLPVRYRQVLVLRELRDLSYKEIGEVLGCSASIIKCLLVRAREALRRCYAAAALKPAVPALVAYPVGIKRETLPNRGGVRYAAEGRLDGRRIYVGSFTSAAAAADALCAWEAQRQEAVA